MNKVITTPVTRRSFLKRAGFAVMGLWALPAFLSNLLSTSSEAVLPVRTKRDARAVKRADWL